MTINEISVTADITVTAIFKKLTFTVKYTTDRNWTIENKENQTVINGWELSYGQGLNDINDLYVYYILLEGKGGQNVYIEIHCFENEFDYILNEFI